MVVRRVAAAALLLALPAPSASFRLGARLGVPRMQAGDVESPFAGLPEPSFTPPKPSTPPPNMLELTVENVNAVLEEIRPYLIQDGGNVAVAGVDAEDMDILLELQGACGGCPSSSTTMKMGIERLLREKWPTLNEVIEVTDVVGGGASVLSVETAEEALSRPRTWRTATPCTFH